MKSNHREKRHKDRNVRDSAQKLLETQRKNNNKFVWDKNSGLAVNELAKVLLQSKKNQSCLGLTPARCVLVPSQVIIYILLI